MSSGNRSLFNNALLANCAESKWAQQNGYNYCSQGGSHMYIHFLNSTTRYGDAVYHTGKDGKMRRCHLHQVRIRFGNEIYDFDFQTMLHPDTNQLYAFDFYCEEGVNINRIYRLLGKFFKKGLPRFW